jgi:hypothetical protein
MITRGFGIDPGAKYMGLAYIDRSTMLADLYSSNLCHFADDGVVTIKTLPQTIENFICAFLHILIGVDIIGIELQKISVPIIKLIAFLLHKTISRHLPNKCLRMIDPLDNRKYWGITVTKKSFPGKTQREKYVIRKSLSGRTKVIDMAGLERVHRAFYADKQFHADSLDALLLIVTFMAKFDVQVLHDRRQTCNMLEIINQPVERRAIAKTITGKKCGFVGGLKFSFRF